MCIRDRLYADDGFLAADGEALPTRQLVVVVLYQEAVAAAPVVLAEHRAGGKVLRLGFAVQLGGDKIAHHADAAVLADDFQLNRGIFYITVGAVKGKALPIRAGHKDIAGVLGLDNALQPLGGAACLHRCV